MSGDPVAYYQAVVQMFEDGTVNVLFDQIVDGDNVRLYEQADDTLVDGLEALAVEINAGRVLPVPADPYFVDGMIASHDDQGLFVRTQRAGSDQHSWQSVTGREGIRPDEQIHEWIDSATANIIFDPRSDA